MVAGYIYVRTCLKRREDDLFQRSYRHRVGRGVADHCSQRLENVMMKSGSLGGLSVLEALQIRKDRRSSNQQLVAFHRRNRLESLV